MPSASWGDTTSYSIGRVLSRASTSKAPVRDSPKSTHRSQSGRMWSAAFISMNVANASFSQMPFHHFIVTRFAEPLVGELVADHVGHPLQLGLAHGLGVDEQEHLAVRDAAHVLHRAEGEVGQGDLVELVARIDDVVVVGEEAQRGLADLGGERREVAHARGVGDPHRRVVHEDGRRHLERPDDERDEVRRHLHRVEERDPGLPAAAGSRRSSPALEMAVNPSATTSEMPNTAFRSGSSQHGNVMRAWVASNCVVAMMRSAPSLSLNVLR